MYKFEWDEKKNQLNIEKHKLQFESAKELFNNRIDVILDDRIDYKEKRYIGFGELESMLMIVVFTKLSSNKIRIISFRKANKREQKEYYKNRLG